MSLSEIDRLLLERCLDGAPRAWQDFVDRFLGLVVHVTRHTAENRHRKIDDSTRDDLVAEVFLTFVANDFAVLRRFRRNCSLATYLTVISRRVVARRLTNMFRQPSVTNGSALAAVSGESIAPATRLENREEVQQLMTRLDPQEANVVRLYHLEGKSYQEISQLVGIMENSIGPMLTRARAKMRND